MSNGGELHHLHGRNSWDDRRWPGMKVVIVLEGINNIGFSTATRALTAPHTGVSARQIIAGYARLIRQAHAARLRIIAATLTPFHAARYRTPAGEAKREAINRWILTSRGFDAVADFAVTLADSRDRLRLNPAHDRGGHLHPNDAGYRAMAGAIDVSMLLARQGWRSDILAKSLCRKGSDGR
jgi:lysophospholipase L1-like esterase